eukprot:ctg_1136.g446
MPMQEKALLEKRLAKAGRSRMLCIHKVGQRSHRKEGELLSLQRLRLSQQMQRQNGRTAVPEQVVHSAARLQRQLAFARSRSTQRGCETRSVPVAARTCRRRAPRDVLPVAPTTASAPSVCSLDVESRPPCQDAAAAPEAAHSARAVNEGDKARRPNPTPEGTRRFGHQSS